MRGSLFSALSKYAGSDKTSPLENFTSELLAWTVNDWPAFGIALAEFLLGHPQNPRVSSVRAKTQQHTTHGYIDIWLSVTFDDASDIHLLIENKVDSQIGLRMPAEPGADVVRSLPEGTNVAITEVTQVDNYLEYARANSRKTVVLLTKDLQALKDSWQGTCWCQPRRWYEIAMLVRDLGETAGVEKGFLSKQIYEFLQEHSMTRDAVTLDLINGTPQRSRLKELFSEVGARVTRSVPTAVFRKADLDKNGVFAEWHLKDHGEVGLAYADAYADYAVYLKAPDLGDDKFLRKLSEFPAVVNARVVKGRFWEFPFVPIEVGSDFYTLGAEGQIGRLVEGVSAVLEAVKVAGRAKF